MAENELAKEISDLFHFVFTFIAAAMVIAVAASIRMGFGGSQNGSDAIVYHSLGLGPSGLGQFGNGQCTSTSSNNATKYNSCYCIGLWVEKRGNLMNLTACWLVV